MKILYILICLFLFSNLAFAEGYYRHKYETTEKTNLVHKNEMQLITTEPDFNPYMWELQRRIKINWNPPKGKEKLKVVVMFKVEKNGKLDSINIFKSSGNANADRAAINAVKESAPFKPLPEDFKGQSVNIQFTFWEKL